MEISKIYFDMDSVLADFKRGVSELCGIVPPEQCPGSKAEDDRMWEAIRDCNHFYDRLEFMPGAEEMLREIYSRYPGRCQILTGVPKPHRGIEGAGEDKTSWVRRKLSQDIPVNIVLREEKKNFVTGPGCVLIDDLEKNIREWEACGGTGILYVSPEETLKRLAEIDG
ncbi:MAG: hypothetical protein I3I98_07610 [Mobilibacterium timonense]|uniref:5' nucleotidase, NT5C type n=1 Tax=Mobilibacterium timonense TaxID=1871012 RepID=UPI002355B727|nr:hypothetical protein [Mobilibacterium timonense]MBM6991239.1 hypothetical protein [Mobilibacterium timonense]